MPTPPQKNAAGFSELDGQLYDEVFLSPPGPPVLHPLPPPTPPRRPSSSSPTPTTGSYPLYLTMQLDRCNGEIARYNNNAQLFNDASLTFPSPLDPQPHPHPRTAPAVLKASLVCFVMLRSTRQFRQRPPGARFFFSSEERIGEERRHQRRGAVPPPLESAPCIRHRGCSRTLYGVPGRLVTASVVRPGELAACRCACAYDAGF